jgi:hypothetical protein
MPKLLNKRAFLMIAISLAAANGLLLSETKPGAGLSSAEPGLLCQKVPLARLDFMPTWT